MKQFYELMEEARDIIVDKMLAPGYELTDTYKAVMYAFIHAALHVRSGVESWLVRPLREKIPPLLRGVVERELSTRLQPLIRYIDEVLSSDKPVLAGGEADVKHVIEAVRKSLGKVDYVLVYDCMSAIEQLVISAYLKANGVKTLFLSELLVNPVGLTRFITGQFQGITLRGVARYIASQLEAQSYNKNSFIDMRVHEKGSSGVEEFVESIAIENIASDILNIARRGRALILSDHGYDIIASIEEGYLYVIHGFRYNVSSKHVPLLLLSRISLFMVTHGVA